MDQNLNAATAQAGRLLVVAAASATTAALPLGNPLVGASRQTK